MDKNKDIEDNDVDIHDDTEDHYIGTWTKTTTMKTTTLTTTTTMKTTMRTSGGSSLCSKASCGCASLLMGDHLSARMFRNNTNGFWNLSESERKRKRKQELKGMKYRGNLERKEGKKEGKEGREEGRKAGRKEGRKKEREEEDLWVVIFPS